MNIYNKGYKNELSKNKLDFTEPAENFIRIYKMLVKKKKLSCLDFGVGDGRHFEYLIRRGHKVIGTDIFQSALNLTKKRILRFIGKKRGKKITKNLYLTKNYDEFERLKLKKKDLIVCWETIHWVGIENEITNYLSLFNQLLKKNGQLIVTFPAENHYLINKRDKIKKDIYKSSTKERKKMIFFATSLNSLLKIFKKNKFKLKAIFKYSHGRKLFGKNKDSLKSINYSNKLFSMYAFVLNK